MFGNNDKWDGLAVFFDSFDNDNQVSLVCPGVNSLYLLNVQ